MHQCQTHKKQNNWSGVEKYIQILWKCYFLESVAKSSHWCQHRIHSCKCLETPETKKHCSEFEQNQGEKCEIEDLNDEKEGNYSVSVILYLEFYVTHDIIILVSNTFFSP